MAESEQEHKRLFDERVGTLIENKKCEVLTKPKYDEIIDILEKQAYLASLPKDEKPKNYYYLIKAFAVFKVGSEILLVRKNSDFEKCCSDDSGNVKVDLERVKRMVHSEELFKLIKDAHLEIMHGAGKKTYDIVRQKFSNISRDVCNIFTDLCSCRVSRRAPGRPESFTPIYSDTLNSRGQVYKMHHLYYKLLLLHFDNLLYK
jgi:hypothetical protein